MAAHYADSFTDYAGERLTVEWTEAVWAGHLGKHPQLINMKNASLMIQSTVAEPSVVMKGKRPQDEEPTVVYYKELRSHQQFVTYIKVVCGLYGKKCAVKTVFEERAPADLVIQERKYPEDFKEVWRTKTNIW